MENYNNCGMKQTGISKVQHFAFILQWSVETLLWGRVRVEGGGRVSAICLEGAHKPEEGERVHHSLQVSIPCDLKIFKKQVNLSCWGTSYHTAPGDSEQENTRAVGTAANTDSPTKEAEAHQRVCDGVLEPCTHSSSCKPHLGFSLKLHYKKEDFTLSHLVCALLTQWAAAALRAPSSLRKSLNLAVWSNAKMKEVPSHHSKTRVQPAAQAKQRKAKPRSATDRFAQKLEEWPLMSASENALWTTTRRSMPSVLPWTMTSVANGCPRLPHCSEPSTASLLSQFSWALIHPVSPAPTVSATGHQWDRQRWGRHGLSRPG